MLKTPLSRFHVIGLLEGISYLLLLAIAMPLKYILGYDLAVLIVGWIHGILFIAYFITLAHVWYVHRWPFGRVSGAAIASILPFGTFVLSAKLRLNEEISKTNNLPD
ncbi:integral membrane protein [Marininema mesophilum]|uniref:Integral membrane protein n=1 Tax=Marininema mesophilum TaxID=1048340 RepID=A0A1H2YHM1_9BACL|nr:DUF3817 domain-containing protein [Marininema mesophilum]SDX04308.1 integral membrane protein [Marininema mesophilum]